MSVTRVTQEVEGMGEAYAPNLAFYPELGDEGKALVALGTFGASSQLEITPEDARVFAAALSHWAEEIDPSSSEAA